MENTQNGPANDPTHNGSTQNSPAQTGRIDSGTDPAIGPKIDAGIAGLVAALRILGVPADYESVRHACGGETPGLDGLVRQAQRLGAKARVVKTSWERLERTPLPALVPGPDGGFLVLAKANADRVLVHDAVSGQTRVIDRAAFEPLWSGRLLCLGRKGAMGMGQARFDGRWIGSVAWKYRSILSEVLLASFFIQLFGLVTPLFFQVVVDKVVVHRSLGTLDVLMIGMLAVTLFEAVLGGLRTYTFAHTANRLDVELGAKLYQRLLSLPMGYFAARRVGDSVARVRELETIRNFMTSSTITLVLDLLFTVVFLGVMMVYSPMLTAVVAASFPVYIAISLVATPILRRRLDEKFARGAENQSFLVETVSSIETVKAMAVEPRMQRKWEDQLSGYVTAGFRAGNLNNIASQSVQFVSKLSTMAVLWLGAKLVIEGTLTVGELVAFNMFAGRVVQPVLRIAQLWQDFQQVRLSMQRIGDILNTAPEPLQTAGKAAMPAIKGDLTFDHVTFRYRHDGPETLSDVSLHIPAGQIVGVVGTSGSGKSTLAKLLQRFHVPERGRVMVDGTDLSTADAVWLRRQIGVVLQDNVLFSGTIRENIALTDPTMDMARVVAAAKLAGAHDFIAELPDGYDTVVGERGASLSGGQRQRVAIARALVTNPRILIFDEATSALDHESERIIQANMRRICAGRTVLIIAHRLSTVAIADRIVTVERGRVVEDGAPDELLRRGGRYATLFRGQMGGHPAAPVAQQQVAAQPGGLVTQAG
ncbi:type I secretion system permease/ATPase [Azospirillum doebereinerae]|uniref:type I secretion system permease/ATPase n=1 Tax=Azospirillum doebereinerae TaxID=92933 RepID=UPI001EE55936|nr:type I secretion system permease/ATPase [Azospirillum doebereinerae]MCG5238846.1 type I secretion system permease/ATPase [Azospirillum doebereinerae]